MLCVTTYRKEREEEGERIFTQMPPILFFPLQTQLCMFAVWM